MNYAPEVSGTAPYTTGWAQHLSRWADLVVLAGVPHYPQWHIEDGYGAWRADTVEYGVRVRRLRHHVPSVASPLRRVAHESTFAARVLSQRLPRPDAVLAVSPPLFGAAAARRIARRSKVPFGLVVHDIYSLGLEELGHSPGRATAALADLEARVVRGADRILTISDRFCTTLVERLGASEDRVSVVGNWSQLPAAEAARAAVRGRHGWAGGDFVALHAGNMGAKQGLENVVAAARLADDRGSPVRFVLVGDGNRRAALGAAAAGVRRITFLPPASPREYAGLLAAADVLLVNEAAGVAEMSLPSKLTSYFAAGRPVIAATGAGGATAEVLRSSAAGVRVEPDDPSALLDAVLALRGNPSAGANYGQSALTYSGQHHGVDAAMRDYDAWVHQLLGTTPDSSVTAVRNRAGTTDRRRT